MNSEKLYGPLYGEDGEQLPGLDQLLQDVTIARDRTLSARDLAESLVEEARKEGGLEIEWRGETELRLRRLDGEWTMWHDLKGDPGKGVRGDPGRSLRGSQNEDGSVLVEEELTDGSWAEVGVISPPEPLDVESQVILPSGNTQVTMTSGASFEVQRGQRGVSVDDILQDGGTLEVALTDDSAKTFDVSPLIAGAVEAVATQVTDARDAAQAAQAQTEQLFASTSGEAITDEWLLAKLPATQITGPPTDGEYPILWPEGAAGVYRIERNGEDTLVADEHTHDLSGATVRRPVLRDEDGKAVGYDTPQITRG